MIFDFEFAEGCDTNKSKVDKNITDDTNSADIEPEMEPPFETLFSVSNSEIFDLGYFEYQSDYEGEIYFNRTCNYDITWKAYILDEKIGKDTLDVLLSMEPVVVNENSGNVTVNVMKGQWIYIYCECNSTTSETATDGSYECGHFASYV